MHVPFTRDQTMEKGLNGDMRQTNHQVKSMEEPDKILRTTEKKNLK